MREQDLYFRVTDKKGKQTVRYARVWDADAFIATQQRDNAKEGNTVTPATEADYRKANWRKQ